VHVEMNVLSKKKKRPPMKEVYGDNWIEGRAAYPAYLLTTLR